MSTLNDPFSLFRLEERFALDEDRLKIVYQTLMRKVHPDQFAGRSAQEQRVAAQWATRIEESYETLRNPVKRASLLCEKAGASIEAETNTSMSMDFLMRQMQLREALEAAHGDDAKKAVLDSVKAEHDAVLSDLARAIDEDKDWKRAADLTRRLMFYRRMLG